MIGEATAEFKGRTAGVRVLSDGKVETSEQGSGRILGIEATAVFSSLAAPLPNGILMGEGNGIITTADGEVVTAGLSIHLWQNTFRQEATTSPEQINSRNNLLKAVEMSSRPAANVE